MERFGPGGNFPVKVVHLQRWSSLACRSGPTENCRSVFRNCRFQSRSSSSQHTVVKMADSSDVSVYECSVCKLQTQDLNFVLMLSCTQGSGTATHLNLFFSSGSHKFLKTNILLASPNVDDVFPRFSLSSM